MYNGLGEEVAMNNVYERLKSCYESIKGRIPFIPKIALILGSGLGDYAETIKKIKTIDYSEIKDFPVSTVSGHKGRFVFGYVGEVPKNNTNPPIDTKDLWKM